jgi:hypothetical protein
MADLKRANPRRKWSITLKAARKPDFEEESEQVRAGCHRNSIITKLKK